MCNFTVDKVLRLSYRSLFRQLAFLLFDSVIARGFPVSSIIRCMHVKYSYKNDALARRFPSAIGTHTT